MKKYFYPILFLCLVIAYSVFKKSSNKKMANTPTNAQKFVAKELVPPVQKGEFVNCYSLEQFIEYGLPSRAKKNWSRGAVEGEWILEVLIGDPLDDSIFRSVLIFEQQGSVLNLVEVNIDDEKARGEAAKTLVSQKIAPVLERMFQKGVKPIEGCKNP